MKDLNERTGRSIPFNGEDHRIHCLTGDGRCSCLLGIPRLSRTEDNSRLISLHGSPSRILPNKADRHHGIHVANGKSGRVVVRWLETGQRPLDNVHSLQECMTNAAKVSSLYKAWQRRLSFISPGQYCVHHTIMRYHYGIETPNSALCAHCGFNGCRLFGKNRRP